MKFNLEYISNNAKSVISPVIITNTDQTSAININDVNAIVAVKQK